MNFVISIDGQDYPIQVNNPMVAAAGKQKSPDRFAPGAIGYALLWSAYESSIAVRTLPACS
jgi:hypothetical protein